MRKIVCGALLVSCCIGGGTRVIARGPLAIDVTPSVSRAPALLTVRVSVELAVDNRSLRVVAESPDFYRSSELQIDGARGVPLNVFEFRNLPPGLYQITGTLIGNRGPRATASRIAKVEPPFGSR